MLPFPMLIAPSSEKNRAKVINEESAREATGTIAMTTSVSTDKQSRTSNIMLGKPTVPTSVRMNNEKDRVSSNEEESFAQEMGLTVNQLPLYDSAPTERESREGNMECLMQQNTKTCLEHSQSNEVEADPIKQTTRF